MHRIDRKDMRGFELRGDATMDTTLRAAPTLGTVPAQVPFGDLASEPVVKIGPGSVRLDLRDLWRYRELFYFLTLRDIKVCYKQSSLSIAWVLVLPVLMTAIFPLLAGRTYAVRRPHPDGFRAALFGRPFDWAAVAISAVVTVAASFRRSTYSAVWK
jgi:hypothetical protein